MLLLTGCGDSEVTKAEPDYSTAHLTPLSSASPYFIGGTEGGRIVNALVSNIVPLSLNGRCSPT
jgi:hypothetical protein